VQNNLIAKGLLVITSNERPVHVSGHAAQEELAKLYELTRPLLAVPVHGETRHQNEHARIAKACNVKHTLIPANGQIVRLGPGVHEVVTEVPAGRWGLDGKVLRRLDTGVSKDRKKMGVNGAAVITLVMDAKGKIAREPQIALMGLAEDDGKGSLQRDLAALVLDCVLCPQPRVQQLLCAGTDHRYVDQDLLSIVLALTKIKPIDRHFAPFGSASRK